MRITYACCFVNIVAAALLSTVVSAQAVRNRITDEVDTGSSMVLAGSANPKAATRYDIGRAVASTPLNGITMYFKPSAEQKAELDALVKAQQTPTSSWYHKWLTPAEYAGSFGLSNSDIARIQNWLQEEGFTVDRVSDSHTSISFSGTASQLESAFQTEIDNYKINGQTHLANSTQISVPSTLAGIVQSVRNLDDFRPKPYVRFHAKQLSSAKADFTSSQSGSHYLTPGDIATIYDIKAAYNSGYTGAGQSIAVVGQSEIAVADIEAFESAAGLPTKDPTLVLVPNSGTATIFSDDEAESDLDLEYSGGIAKGATINFVYVGSNQNYSVFDALEYAVDTKLAPIITMSYGECEADLSAGEYSTLESVMEQGASQGQSIIVAAGDDGSTACYADVSNNTVSAAEEAPAVSYPAGSAYATALGGTEFPAEDISSSNTTYWESGDSSDVISSALSYIPEQVWNDDSTTVGAEYGAAYALSSGGGGSSTVTARPSWQTGVSGIPSGNYRLLPDISLDASPDNAGYLYCSSDTSGWSSGQQSSCDSGFRDSSTQYLTVAGGTSFDAPIFAGMLAIINQKENSTGQGLVNPTLYTLAANPATYASAFHDITSGSNKCTAGSSYCSSAGASEYAATTGYDEASGLGSVDLYNLMTAWPTSSSASLEPTTTSLTTTPTGTLTVAVDGTTETSSLALSNGSATYSFSSATSGSHVITAAYSGDSAFAASSGSLTMDVGGSSGTSSSGTFTLASTNVSVSQGSSGTSTITIASQNAYAGTVGFTLSTSNTSLEEYGCYDVSDTPVAAGGTATASLTIYTSESACNATSSVKKGARHAFVKTGTKSIAFSPRASPPCERLPVKAVAAFLGCFLFGMRKRSRIVNRLRDQQFLYFQQCQCHRCSKGSVHAHSGRSRYRKLQYCRVNQFHFDCSIIRRARHDIFNR
jgi:subtilase family serine protease